MPQIYDEMKDQFQAMRKTAPYLDSNLDAFQRLLRESGAQKLLFLGCGSSYCIAESMAVITSHYLGSCAGAVAAGDMLVHPDTYAPQFEGSLVVAVSRSGHTTEIYKSLEVMRGRVDRFSLIAITCTEGSLLADQADLAVEMPWAFDESVCQTRTVSCLYFAWCWLVARAVEDKALHASLTAVMDEGDAFLDKWEPTLKAVAEKGWDHACVMADADIKGIAEEGALAFKEVCQLPSNCYHILDSRHGPFVLFSASTLAVIAASANSGSWEADYIRDVVKKGCEVVVYSDLPQDEASCTNITFGRKLSHAARGLPLIALTQLLAYYKSIFIGVDPENPDGLDAWIEL